MNKAFLPINIIDHPNKSTHGLLHHIILNNSAISDKYKSLTIINNTINYNTNIKKNEGYLFKKPKIKKKNSLNNTNINNDIDSDFSVISNSLPTSKQKKQIDNLKRKRKKEKG